MQTRQSWGKIRSLFGISGSHRNPCVARRLLLRTRGVPQLRSKLEPGGGEQRAEEVGETATGCAGDAGRGCHL